MAKQADYVRYTIRVPADLYERIKDAAGEKSVNAEIVERLESSLETGEAKGDLSGTITRMDRTIKSLLTVVEVFDSMIVEAATGDDERLKRAISGVVNPPKSVEEAQERAQESQQIAKRRAKKLEIPGIPTQEQWAILKAAPAEIQPGILEALSSMDVDRAMDIARSAKKNKD